MTPIYCCDDDGGGGGGGGNLVWIDTVDPVAVGVTFVGLDGNATDTIGYKIIGGILKDLVGPVTALALRINGDAGAVYNWVRTNNVAGTITGTQSSAQTEISLLPVSLDDDRTAHFMIDIPVSRQGTPFVTGVGVVWTAGQEGPSEGESHATGWGRYIPAVAANITSISILAIGGGGFKAGTRISIYRYTRTP